MFHKQLLIGLIFFSFRIFGNEFTPYTRRVDNTITFTPKNEGFEFFLGPESELLLISSKCDEIVELQKKFIEWNSNVQKQSVESNKCYCGEKEIPEKTAMHFKRILMKRAGIHPEKEKMELFRFSKKRGKRNIGKAVSDLCYLNIDGVMPKKAEKLAKHQIYLDELNFFDNQSYDIDGVNCYNISLNANDVIDSERHISPLEMSKYLKPPLCEVVAPKNNRPGDLLVYYRSEKYEQASIDAHLNGGKSVKDIYLHIDESNPLHAATFISDKFVFEKKGGAAGFPVQFSRESESRKLNKEVQSETVISLSYRCKNKQEIKEFAKKYPEIYEFFNQVEEYEKCFEGFYTSDDRNLRSKIYQLVKDGGAFDILNKLIYSELEKYKIYETYRGHQYPVGYVAGSEEQVILLELLERKLHTMIDDRNGRGHDGPEDFFDWETGKFLWE